MEFTFSISRRIIWWFVKILFISIGIILNIRLLHNNQCIILYRVFNAPVIASNIKWSIFNSKRVCSTSGTNLPQLYYFIIFIFENSCIDWCYISVKIIISTTAYKKYFRISDFFIGISHTIWKFFIDDLCKSIAVWNINIRCVFFCIFLQSTVTCLRCFWWGLVISSNRIAIYRECKICIRIRFVFKRKVPPFFFKWFETMSHHGFT